MVTNILEYLEGSAGRYPDKTAFSDEEKSCTFKELKGQADRIASALAGRIEQGSPVPVFMEKSCDLAAVLMGIVSAGGFYVVIDIRQPESRIAQIMAALGASLAIISKKDTKDTEKLLQMQSANPGIMPQLVWFEDIKDTPEKPEILEEIRSRAKDTDPLYGIFTSGSTGVPKGVVVSHRSVIDFIEHFTDIFQITEEDVLGNQAPWDFDVSVKDIYSGLKTGASVQIIPRRMFSFPVQLIDYLCERQVTTLIWAVSALCIITTLHGFEVKVPEKIKKVLFSGEVMPIKHLNEWRKYLPDATYVNLYGPTEITCNCTYYVVDKTFENGDTLPIGSAFPNETVFLLDEEDREIRKPGEKGEICVTGTALALGYYNNPEQTQKAFVQNPLCKAYPQRMYRTGDLGYYGQDNRLYFASRRDFQIKHMGHRIELGEIEAAMEQIDEIQRSCCIFDAEKQKIMAFYMGEIERRELKKKMGERLPMFMIPNKFCRVENFPLNKNGKIDRKLLLKNLG